ncbi:hypothetical protein ACFQ7N_09145 [Streptomyces niveus]|uniref:hypothetical protein n=1 Tax=Streptomyces niveus TaxID=193462 RepID=UPI00367BE96E
MSQQLSFHGAELVNGVAHCAFVGPSRLVHELIGGPDDLDRAISPFHRSLGIVRAAPIS